MKEGALPNSSGLPLAERTAEGLSKRLTAMLAEMPNVALEEIGNQVQEATSAQYLDSDRADVYNYWNVLCEYIAMEIQERRSYFRKGDLVEFKVQIEPGPGLPMQKADGPYNGIVTQGTGDGVGELTILSTDPELVHKMRSFFENEGGNNSLGSEGDVLDVCRVVIDPSMDEKAEGGQYVEHLS